MEKDDIIYYVCLFILLLFTLILIGHYMSNHDEKRIDNCCTCCDECIKESDKE